MLAAKVVLDIPTQAFDTPYTYYVPEDMTDAAVGCAVLVPLGGRKAVGYIIAIESLDEYAKIDPSRLKPISRVLTKPYFDEEGAACACFLSERYVAPLSSCIRLFTPPAAVPRIVRQRQGGWRLEEPQVGEVDDRWVTAGAQVNQFVPRKNAVKQIAVLEAVRKGDVRMSELALEFGNVASAIKALEKKQAVRVERRRRLRGIQGAAVNGGGVKNNSDATGVGIDAAFASANTALPASTASAQDEKELTAGQAQALAAIEKAADAASGEVVLIDGVTGSGKTEVYLRAIQRVLDAGRNAIVLVPEIALTPQTVARFRGRFGSAVAVMHSRMSAGERYDQWDFIRSGAARVVVGARSALFTPMANVGLVVIDEEHETTYKQENAPRYVSRDVAQWMMRRSGGVLVLGSATPSIEALYKARTNSAWHKVEMPLRANGRPLPTIEIIDMTVEFSSGHKSMFSRRLINALKEELTAGHKAVLLLNQRGFAKFLLCRDCGFVPECRFCSATLKYHEQGNKLVCHQCGYTVEAPSACPVCGSPYLKRFGAGTQRVEAELRQLLDAELGVLPPLDVSEGEGGYDGESAESTREIEGACETKSACERTPIPIIRMDADTTTTKGAHQRLLEEFAAAPRAVLLGTQMIAKGLDFDDVTLVGVINADTQLHLPDFRAGERTFDLIEQVAGRAGRANLAGRVLVQTYEADSYAIRAAAVYDREMFLNNELPKRKVLRFPPFVRLANILVWGVAEEDVRRVANEIHAQVAQIVADFGGDDWEVLAAGPCALEKRRNNYRWHVIVKCPTGGDLSGVLGPYFRKRKTERGVNVALDIDPIDLL